MIVYETRFHQLLVNKSHEDCGEYSCHCTEGKPWRFWIKNIQKPLNSGWREFPTEAEAMKTALELKPDVDQYECDQESV
jgi:hypothetical protein